MEITKQVCSLELAKKLKELGAILDHPTFVFTNMNYEDEGGAFVGVGKGVDDWKLTCVAQDAILSNDFEDGDIPTFTVAELTEFLVQHKHNFLPYFCDNPRERCWVYNFGQYPEYVKAETLVDCLAKMIVYLLENSLIKSK